MREKLAAVLPAPYAQVLRDTRPDEEIAAQVAHYAQAVAPKAQRAVGRIEGSFVRGGATDSTAGRLVADAQLAATRHEGAQVAFMNPGGMRANLECAAPPCTVTFGQAFSMQPFSNGLVVMTLTGTQIRTLLESQQKREAGEPTILQPSAGFTYTWKSDAPRGERARDLQLDGQPIRADARYRVTVNGFLAEGGDGFVLLRDGRDRIGGGEDLDALVDYLAAAPRTPDPVPRMHRTP
jgi:5'-nucleotidase